MSTAGARSLGPGWRSKGFQPPAPAVPVEDGRNRSGSHAGSEGSQGGGSRGNPFSALDEDDDFITVGAGGKALPTAAASDAAPPPASPRRASSRSEALRSGGGGGGGGGGRPKSGRSLADLASRLGTNEAAPRKDSRRSPDRPAAGPPGGGGGGGGGLGDGGGRFRDAGRNLSSAAASDYVEDKSVVRYTREKLLSLRPARPSNELPGLLEHMNGASVVTLEALDPGR